MSTWLSSSVINTMSKSNLEKKGFIWLALLHHSPWGREVEAKSQAGTWRQEPEQGLWSNSADWFVSYGLLGLFSCTNPGPPTQEWLCPQWAMPSHSLISPKKMPPKTFPQACLTETFSPSPQNCEKTCFCHLSHPTCGLLLQQLSQANETHCLSTQYPKTSPDAKAEWQKQGKVQLVFN